VVRRFIVVVLVFSILLSGCSGRFSQNDASKTIQMLPSEVVEDVARLPILDMSSVESYEQFSKFVDFINTLADILNEKGGDTFAIPKIDVTPETFQKASGLITKYGPLINNYNDVVNTARQVDQGESDITEFYKKSAVFGIEVAVIYTGPFYSPAYETTGILYRASGLNRLAFDCPSCVSFILSSAHWTIRTAFVEESSKMAETILDAIESAYNAHSPDPVGKAEEFIKSHFGSN
jgi:hypothetical protein